MNYFKTLINSNNIRFIDRKYNLDLSYITPRIIAMGFPTIFPKSLIKNSVTDIANFLNERHGNNYILINLSDKSYDSSQFKGLVVDYQMVNSKPIDLILIFDICEKAYDYLNQNIFNTIAIKCKDGKSLIGVVICSFLLYIKKFTNINDAFNYYSYKRLYKGEKGISQPSHKKYVEYFFNILSNNKFQFPFRIKITSIVIKNMYEIYNKGTYIVEYFDYTNKKYQEIHVTPNNYECELNNNNNKTVTLKLENLFTQEQYGDVDIKISYNEYLLVKKLGKISFNTAFIKSNENKKNFNASQIDQDNILIDPDSFLKKQKFPENYSIQINFKILCAECSSKEKNKCCQNCKTFFEKNKDVYKKWEQINEYKNQYKKRNLVYNKYILFGNIDNDDSDIVKNYEENKKNQQKKERHMSEFDINNGNDYFEGNNDSVSYNSDEENIDDKDNNNDGENKKTNKLNDSFENDCFIF